MLKFLKDIFHVHRYETVKKDPIEIEVTVFFKFSSVVDGLKVLEKCSCGDYKAYLITIDGDKREKVPEILFPEHFGL